MLLHKQECVSSDKVLIGKHSNLYKICSQMPSHKDQDCMFAPNTQTQKGSDKENDVGVLS